MPGMFGDDTGHLVVINCELRIGGAVVDYQFH